MKRREILLWVITAALAHAAAIYLIERIDPSHGDVYTLLSMGFDECYDE